MKDVFLFFFSAFVLFSCKEVKLEEKVKIDLSASTKTFSIEDGHKITLKHNGNVVKTKARMSKGGFVLSTKKKTALLGKKELSFYWTGEKSNKVLFEKLIAFQNTLKSKKLIGFESSFKNIQFEDSIANVFFQEGIEKHLIESNENREGILFISGNKGLEIAFKPKRTSKETVNKLLKRVKLWEAGELPTACFFDVHKTSQVLSVLKEFAFENEAKVGFLYYLNPVSNLIEPLVHFAPNTTLDKVKLKLLSDSIFKSEINITDTIGCFNKDEFTRYFELKEGVYKLKEDSVEISSNVIAPKGIKISLTDGQEINLVNGGFILSFSPVNINGIKVYSSDSTGRGLHVINARSESKISNSIFDGLKNLEYKSWKLPSAVTFYESPVSIFQSKFLNNNCEDGLNLFRSFPFLLDDCVFENTFSDAFDADFSDGTIKNCVFNKLGNDGIDVSGSQVNIVGCTFTEVADKALSSGEASVMIVDSILIDGASLAVTAKDKSSIKIDNSEIKNSEVVFCAFQKKNEFGPSKISGRKVTYSDFKKDFLIETKSSLTLDGKETNKYTKDVRGILYGKEYGKATVK